MVRLVTIPEEDVEFKLAVHDAHARIDGATTDWSQWTANRLLEELKLAYPNVAIRQQDGLASLEAEPSTWYVYRDAPGWRARLEGDPA